MEQDDSVSGNICQRSCNQCKELSEVCNDCESVGYTSVDVLFRPCRKCLEAGSTCHCLLPLAASADCASAQQVYMEMLQKEFASTASRAPLLPFPDAAHVIKCIRSSFFWWWLLIDGYLVNVRVLLALYYDKSKEVSCKIRAAVSLKALRNRDKMDVDTALELLALHCRMHFHKATSPSHSYLIQFWPSVMLLVRWLSPSTLSFTRVVLAFCRDFQKNRVFIVNFTVLSK